MNRSTSRPSSSRKYSAIVSPVSATRRRAPGGSFIWPNTMASFEMTPESFISWYRSLPSRVRSPTPANTEIPPCSMAMLWISSCISTVLPTPAPPNRPILPPFVYGASRSTTLMPVSSISVEADRCSKSGAGRWIGYTFSRDGGSRPSIGSPSTLNTRPRVSGPTATEIGPPVSTASMPRTRPSVDAMAMHRTRLSPRWVATSTVRLTSRPPSPLLSILIAFRISGRWPRSNSMSTTGPMT